jgi:beta-glucosidase
MRCRFPPGFKLGTAIAATQVEGHCQNHDWLRFAREPGRVNGGDTPAVACDHWNRWRSDIELQKDLGVRAHRLSVEWARVEPRSGEFDRAALEQYRREIGTLRDAGIEPWVTLYHFTLPTWVSDGGGLLHDDLPALLERFARSVARTLGDICKCFVTVNEPNVVAVQGYLFGEWPPGHKGHLREAMMAQRRLLEAHVRMYRALHEEVDGKGADARVGVAHHLRVVEPERKHSIGDRLAVGLVERAFNQGFLDALLKGKFNPGLDQLVKWRTGFDVAEAKGTQDFLGINYYTRDLVRLNPAPRRGFIERKRPGGAEVSDLGWEVYPQGLYQLLMRFGPRAGLPVVITENGLADADDDQRPSFLVRHLDALCRAADEGVPVEAYFHWSLLDNFEWAEGYTPRFGLYAVDYKTQARTLRASGALYKKLIEAGGISNQVWQTHGQRPARAGRVCSRNSMT